VLVTFTVNGKSPARVGQYRTHQDGFAAGQRVLTSSPRARHSASDGRHPTSRTSSPYSLSEAVENLSSDIEGTNTESQPVPDTLSGTLNRLRHKLDPHSMG